MQPRAKILDIGFGCGFPLIELAQRFGPDSQVYGIDMWAEALLRTHEKIRVLSLENITIFEQSAVTIPLEDNSLDLVVSNLGINNFDEKEKVFAEVFRVLKTGGKLCLCTNPIGTFKEFFDVFEKVLDEMELSESKIAYQSYLDHRGTEESIVAEVEVHGLAKVRSVSDQSSLRFADAGAIFDHGLMRFGFLASWLGMIAEDKQDAFFENLCEKINEQIQVKGTFTMRIPILYLEFVKN